MVDVVLGIAVFVLAVAMVGLFAMMGELASRVPRSAELSASGASHPPHPIPEARLGAEPTHWPAELASVRDAELAHVLVFGSTCVTCTRIASGETGPLTVLPPPLAVVVSAPHAQDGARFLARYPMAADFPHLVDVGGGWVTSNFDVGISPSVLVFERGRLRSAHTFVAATALSQLTVAEDHKPHFHASAKPATATTPPLARDGGPTR